MTATELRDALNDQIAAGHANAIVKMQTDPHGGDQIVRRLENSTLKHKDVDIIYLLEY